MAIKKLNKRIKLIVQSGIILARVKYRQTEETPLVSSCSFLIIETAAHKRLSL